MTASAGSIGLFFNGSLLDSAAISLYNDSGFILSLTVLESALSRLTILVT